MTDTLAERFAALADLHDDSDWLDVRRRARRRTRFALPAALVAAAVLTAAAVAATGGWLFSGSDGRLVGVTHLTLHGQSWRVTLTEQKLGKTSFISVGATNGGRHSQGGIGDMILLGSTQFAASSTNIPGGSIWAGTTLPSIVRVSITDYAGRVYTTGTIAAPRTAKTPYRYWALAVSGSPGATLTTYDANGTKVRWRLGMSAPN